MDELAIGVDVVDVKRFERALERFPGLLWTLFTPAERASCIGGNRVERLAARYAAKEAAFKALGDGWPRIGYRDVVVASSPSGKPHLRLRGRAAALVGRRPHAVSLSHDGGVAMAEVVVAPAGASA